MKKDSTERKKTKVIKKKRIRRKKSRIPAAAVIVTAAAVIVLAVCAVLASQPEKAESKSSSDAGAQKDTSVVMHNGTAYQYNEDLKTLLFLGIDKRETELSEHLSGRGGQSDCILLFIMDPSDKTITTLQISRDTMTDVDIYDINGNKLDTEYAQITLQYAYGDGRARSCRLTRDAVSELLYGVKIDSYFAMNMEGFATATDLVGGVTLTVPEDYTDIDPTFEKGATVTLDGEMARKYVQSRDITVLGSNDDRMERQSQFLSALAQKMTQNSGDTVSYTKLYTELQDYIVTDISADDLAEMSDYEFAGTVTVPGETRAGEEHDEFYVDEAALYELVLELFYVPVQQ